MFPAVSGPPGGREEPETASSGRISKKSHGFHAVGCNRNYNGEYTEFSVLWAQEQGWQSTLRCCYLHFEHRFGGIEYIIKNCWEQIFEKIFHFRDFWSL